MDANLSCVQAPSLSLRIAVLESAQKDAHPYHNTTCASPKFPSDFVVEVLLTFSFASPSPSPPSPRPPPEFYSIYLPRIRIEAFATNDCLSILLSTQKVFRVAFGQEEKMSTAHLWLGAHYVQSYDHSPWRFPSSCSCSHTWACGSHIYTSAQRNAIFCDISELGKRPTEMYSTFCYYWKRLPRQHPPLSPWLARRWLTSSTFNRGWKLRLTIHKSNQC